MSAVGREEGRGETAGQHQIKMENSEKMSSICFGVLMQFFQLCTDSQNVGYSSEVILVFNIKILS